MHDQVVAAVPTPFHADGTLHPAAAARLYSRLAGRVDALFLCGTNGEFAALTPLERRTLATLALEHFAPSAVIVHVGAVSTWAALQVVRALDGLPLERFAALTPMVHGIADAGVVDHFAQLRRALDERTLYAYVYPEIAGNVISPAVYAGLRDVVDGIKASGAGTAALPAYLAARPRARAWTGDDGALDDHLALGGTGTVSGCASVLPDVWGAWAAALRGDGDERAARARVREARAVIGPSIAHLKAALEHLGVPAGPTRMHVDPVSSEDHARITRLLDDRLHDDEVRPARV